MTEEDVQVQKWEKELDWLPKPKRDKIIAERKAGFTRSGIKWTPSEEQGVLTELNALVGRLSSEMKRSPNALYWEIAKLAELQKKHD